MNILFTADIHANKKRLPDVLNFFDFCKETIVKENIDLFIIGGDLWNAMIPNTESSGFTSILWKLNEIAALTSMRIIYGTASHEPGGSLDFIEGLNNNVKVIQPKDAHVEDFDGTRILFIPEPRRSDFISDTVKETSEKINKYLSEVCSHSNADIIVYHGEISGAVMDNGAACKSDYRFTKDMFEKSGAKLLLAGHIHTPQEPFPGAVYVGSPIPCNFGESHTGNVIAFSFENKTVRNFRRIVTGAPAKRTIELKSINKIEDLKKIILTNSDVKVLLPLTPAEKLVFKNNVVSKEIKEATGARSVIIHTLYESTTSVRSKEISRAKTFEEKLKLYSKVNELTLTDSILKKLDNLQKAMYINYSFPSHSFELISLEVKGAKGLKNKETVHIDFSKFDDGIVALIGENGAGKTTLLEMASPFPCLLTRGGTLKSHFYLKDSYKIITYKDETGKYYRFTIQMAAHVETGTVKYFAETSDDNEIYKPVPSCTGNLADYQDYINSLFGDISLYLRTAFFTKGVTKGTPDIASATKSQRITLLSQLLGTENLTSIHELINTELKTVKTELDRFNDLDVKIQEVNEGIKSKNVNITRVANELTEVESQIDLLQSKYPDLEEKAKNFNENYSKIVSFEEMKDKARNSVKELETHLEKLKEHKQKNDFYLAHKEDIAEYQTLSDEYKTLIASIMDLSTKMNEACIQADKKQLSLFELTSKRDNEKAKVERVLPKIEEIKAHLSDELDVCPFCGLKLSEKKKKELAETQLKQRAELNGLVDFISFQKDVINNCEKEIKEATKKHSDAEKKAKELKEQYDELDGKSISISVKLDMDKEYEDYLKYIPVSNLEDDIIRINDKLSKEKDLLTSLESEDFIDFNQQFLKLKEDLSEQKSIKEKLVLDFATLKAELKLLKEENEELNENVLKRDVLLKDFDDYSFLEKAFSNTGIQALELEAAAPSIAELTNQILQESYGDKFTVSFSTLRKGKTKLVDDFAINVTNNESGWTIPIEMLSEGEKTWIIQSLYYAFSLVRMENTGFSFRVRFVDESDGALDSEMRLKYVSMIKSAHKAGNARLTVMITHSQEIKDIVSQTINL